MNENHIFPIQFSKINHFATFYKNIVKLKNNYKSIKSRQTNQNI